VFIGIFYYLPTTIHIEPILLYQIKLFKNGSNLLVTQVEFVVARFNLFNRQVFEQNAGIKEFDTLIKNLNG